MRLSPLTAADIPEVMRIERLPGYEAFIARWELPEHTAQIASADCRYYGLRDEQGLGGFAILQSYREPSVRLRRIAVDGLERGRGTELLRAVMDRVFEDTQAQALHLDVHVDNARAQHVYEREGFAEKGLFDPIHRLMEIPRGRWTELRAR